MMSNILDLRPTIAPKSDQLNADQLIGGPMTITVTRVSATSGDQPVTVHYDGDKGKPYKPCLTMRKVLVLAWGHDGNKWPGRSMRVYNDPDVRFGKDTVGGVRISHLSHIAAKIKCTLAVTKGKKALYEIDRLDDADTELIAAIKAAGDVEALKAAFAIAYKATKDEDRRAAFKAEYDRRMQELAPSTLLQEHVAKVNAAANSDDAAVLLDEARDTLKPPELAELNKAYADRFGGGE
jgi:hypothetical protein